MNTRDQKNAFKKKHVSDNLLIQQDWNAITGTQQLTPHQTTTPNKNPGKLCPGSNGSSDTWPDIREEVLEGQPASHS